MPAKCSDAIATRVYSVRPRSEGTITYPDNLGVMNWGSVAIDPVRELLIVNTSHVATIAQLVPREQADARFAKR